MLFRPQRWFRGAPDMHGGMQPGQNAAKLDELTRPAVMRSQVYGQQTEDGGREYISLPGRGEERGGTARGGLFVSLPGQGINQYETPAARKDGEACEAHEVFGEGTYRSYGRPDLITGDIQEAGWRQGLDDGELVTEYRTATGWEEATRLTYDSTYGPILKVSHLELSAAEYDDERFPADGISIFGFGSDPDRSSDDGLLLFSPTITERVFVTAQMPHAWQEGTDIYPHVHWSPTNTNTGDVVWRLSYQIASVNGTFSGTWTTDDIIVAADGTAEKHQVDSFTAIKMTGHTQSCIIKWKIERIGGDGSDTYNADARLLEFDFHYEKYRFGSKAEFAD